jgi:hypothetical protein
MPGISVSGYKDIALHAELAECCPAANGSSGSRIPIH